MKKFVILTYGFTPPTDEVQRAWGEWFKAAGPRLVDPGSPFGRGVEVTRDGRTELTLQSPSPLVGYCLLNADSLEEAESLARAMPIIESVRVYPDPGRPHRLPASQHHPVQCADQRAAARADPDSDRAAVLRPAHHGRAHTGESSANTTASHRPAYCHRGRREADAAHDSRREGTRDPGQPS
jgi:hypothetical protein